MIISQIRTTLQLLDNTTLKTSYGANVTKREHIFVAVQAENGATGFGEGSPLPHFSGERAREMLRVVEDVFAPQLIGLDPFNIERAVHTLEKTLPHHHASKAALINALFDLQGKLIRRPAHTFLGGLYRDRIPVAGAVGIEDEVQVLERVRTLWEQGIKTVKFKVGRELERDIRIIHRLRECFPADLEIRADANAGFTFSEAKRFLRAVEACRLQYFEQPLRAHDLSGLARLRELGTPIAVDESLFGLEDALVLVRAEAADVFIIKLIKLGGLHQARKVVAVAEAAGVSCVVVSPYETSLGAAANLHLAAGSIAFPYAAELGTGVSTVQLDGSDTLDFEMGDVAVPTKPGVGIELPSHLFLSNDQRHDRTTQRQEHA